MLKLKRKPKSLPKSPLALRGGSRRFRLTERPNRDGYFPARLGYGTEERCERQRIARCQKAVGRKRFPRRCCRYARFVVPGGLTLCSVHRMHFLGSMSLESLPPEPGMISLPLLSIPKETQDALWK